MKLYFSAASPFARAARIVAAERDLQLELVQETSFPPEQVVQHSPAMQVPVLISNDGPLFGTRLIVAYLMAAPPGSNLGNDFAGLETRPQCHWHDAQVLTALEALLDSLVLRSYLVWTGAEHRPDATISLDLADRELTRALRLLDWLETNATPTGFVPEVFSLQDVWLVSALAWTEVRLAIAWRGRPNLEAIVARHQRRSSIIATAPPASMGGQ